MGNTDPRSYLKKKGEASNHQDCHVTSFGFRIQAGASWAVHQSECNKVSEMGFGQPVPVVGLLNKVMC